MHVELGDGDGSCDVGDISLGLTLGGALGGSFGFGSSGGDAPPASTPADNVPLAATMPAGTTATYDAASGKVTLHVPPDLVLVRALGDVPLDWRAKLGLPMPNLGAINKALTPLGHVGIIAKKVQSGSLAASSVSSSQFVTPATPAGSRPMAQSADASSTKKVALVVGGVGALGTVAFLAWQAMR